MQRRDPPPGGLGVPPRFWGGSPGFGGPSAAKERAVGGDEQRHEEAVEEREEQPGGGAPGTGGLHLGGEPRVSCGRAQDPPESTSPPPKRYLGDPRAPAGEGLRRPAGAGGALGGKKGGQGGFGV